MNITGGTLKGRKITAPNEEITRPTLSKVRMGVFNTLYSLLSDFKDCSFLDVYGGSGIMGLEALSRGFCFVTEIEQNKKAAMILKNNYKSLNINAEIIIGNALNIIPKLQHKYTVAYVDPPYNSGIYEETIEKLKNICEITILEHPTKMECNLENIIKQKQYGDKTITYISNN